MAGVFRLSAIREIAPFEGVFLRVFSGERGMLSFVRFEAGGVVPEHSHPHEQLGAALEGEFELTISGEARVVREGDVWHIPSGAVHSARALGGPALALDVFVPPREDYAELLSGLDGSGEK